MRTAHSKTYTMS